MRVGGYMFSKRRKESASIEEANAIDIMKSFAEGKISVYQFWEEYNQNITLFKLINEDEKLPVKNKAFLYQELNLDELYHRCEIFRVVKVYFLRRNIELNFYNEDSNLYSDLLGVIPKYIDIDKVLVDTIINGCPYEIGTKERKKYIKKYIKDNYYYENYPPRWLQGPEWPIIDGKPAKFLYQNKFPNHLKWDDEVIIYHFSDYNGNEVIVEQST